LQLEFSLVKESGLKIIHLITVGGLPEIITDIATKIICQFPIIGKYVAILLNKTTYFFISTKIGRNVSQKTGEKFPLGYFLIAEKV